VRLLRTHGELTVRLEMEAAREGVRDFGPEERGLGGRWPGFLLWHLQLFLGLGELNRQEK
jgi:hypothetical protein